MLRDRFAPSPTGLLHLGHAFSALTNWDSVRSKHGEFLLRIDDIDIARCREFYIQAIFEDLTWLGLEWPKPVMRQSQRQPAYTEALDRLIEQGVCFPCGCTRKDIRNALSAPQEVAFADQTDFEGPSVYPGTCRGRHIRTLQPGEAIRLDMRKAIEALGGNDRVGQLGFVEVSPLQSRFIQLNIDHLLHQHGDFVLARKDIGTSYHLSVVVDDAEQKITRVTRGEDLFGATPLHRLLQQLLGLKPPVWSHHRLIRDKDGFRLAKRNRSTTLRSLRESGLTPCDIRRMVGL